MLFDADFESRTATRVNTLSMSTPPGRNQSKCTVTSFTVAKNVWAISEALMKDENKMFAWIY